MEKAILIALFIHPIFDMDHTPHVINNYLNMQHISNISFLNTEVILIFTGIHPFLCFVSRQVTEENSGQTDVKRLL